MSSPLDLTGSEERTERTAAQVLADSAERPSEHETPGLASLEAPSEPPDAVDAAEDDGFDPARHGGPEGRGGGGRPGRRRGR